MQIDLESIIPKALIKKYGVEKCKLAMESTIQELLLELDVEDCIEQVIEAEEDK